MDNDCSTCDNYKPKAEPEALEWSAPRTLEGRTKFDEQIMRVLWQGPDRWPVLCHISPKDIPKPVQDLIENAPQTAADLKAAEVRIAAYEGQVQANEKELRVLRLANAAAGMAYDNMLAQRFTSDEAGAMNAKLRKAMKSVSLGVMIARVGATREEQARLLRLSQELDVALGEGGG